MAVAKIISGGQTGVDRAALDAGMESGLVVGGWCPKGRKAEDGIIDEKYPLVETEEEDYSVRTEKNVLDSDGTLILNWGELCGGTKYTAQCAARHKKPLLIVDMDCAFNPLKVVEWIHLHRVAIINVAGPRESKKPEAYDRTLEFLQSLFSRMSSVS